MEPSGNAEQLLPCLCIVDAQCDLRSGVVSGSPSSMLPMPGCVLRQRMAPSARAVTVTSNVPPVQLHWMLSVLSQHSGLNCAPAGLLLQAERQAPVFFRSFPARQDCSRKGGGNGTHRKGPAIAVRCYLRWSIRHKAGAQLSIRIWQRPGDRGRCCLVQHTGKIFCCQFLRRDGGFKLRRKGIR